MPEVVNQRTHLNTNNHSSSSSSSSSSIPTGSYNFNNNNNSTLPSFSSSSLHHFLPNNESIQINSDSETIFSFDLIGASGSNSESSNNNNNEEEEEYPDIDELPPLPSQDRTFSFGDSCDVIDDENEENYPNIDELPPITLSNRRGNFNQREFHLLTQNDRENMKLSSKSIAIEDLSRHFRCSRPGCEIDEHTIINPRLRRQQVNQSLFIFFSSFIFFSLSFLTCFCFYVVRHIQDLKILFYIVQSVEVLRIICYIINFKKEFQGISIISR